MSAFQYLSGELNSGKRGRGAENKHPFVTAVATDESGCPGYSVIKLLSGFTKLVITQWVNQRLQPGTGWLKARKAVGHSTIPTRDK